MRAVLVRYGETDVNAKCMFQGCGDIPRTMQTAKAISQRLGASPTPCAGWREWHIVTLNDIRHLETLHEWATGNAR